MHWISASRETERKERDGERECRARDDETGDLTAVSPEVSCIYVCVFDQDCILRIPGRNVPFLMLSRVLTQQRELLCENIKRERECGTEIVKHAPESCSPSSPGIRAQDAIFICRILLMISSTMWLHPFENRSCMGEKNS